MKAQSSSLLVLFLVSYSICTASASATVTPVVKLRKCVKEALVSGDAARRMVTKGDDVYPDARSGTILNENYPEMIAYAISVDEVSNLVKCGRMTGYQVVPRSGGHHFESWSSLNNSLVVDISHMNSFEISDDRREATVGAGIRLGALYVRLNQYGVTFHGGICPTVGLGGYIGVGGYNIQGRQYGMAVDDVTSLQLVLATGELVTASPRRNADLFWAARGGGTYGIITSVTINTQNFPRSATVSIQFPNASTRYEVTRKYIDWAPRQKIELGSQINMYSNSTNMVAWLMGGTSTQLHSLLEASGLLAVPGANINLQDNCSTPNSRNFWSDYATVTTCGDDDDALKTFYRSFNVVPQAFAPIEPAYAYNAKAPDPSFPPATPWPRVKVIDKNYIIQKNNQWSDKTLHGVIDRIGNFPPSQFFWAELTAFNISSSVTKNSSAFAWEDSAYALFRASVDHGLTASQHSFNKAWMEEFDSFLLPKMGTASYAGYSDATLKSNPYSAYYGKNICKLVQVKRRYDPKNFFRNPQSIPPYAPPGVTCKETY